jgi:hypothetical protein
MGGEKQYRAGGAAAMTTTTTDLAAVHRAWGLPDDAMVQWLLRQGIDEAALLNPYPIGAAKVRFLAGNTFDLDPDGDRALTFRATDVDDVIDLIAWQPRTGQLASWRGVAFCLGDVDDTFNPATYFAGGMLAFTARRSSGYWPSVKASPSCALS